MVIRGFEASIYCWVLTFVSAQVLRVSLFSQDLFLFAQKPKKESGWFAETEDVAFRDVTVSQYAMFEGTARRGNLEGWKGTLFPRR